MSAGQATILHADADSFFASVEQRDDPRLLGKPVIVGAGVVLAASYEAKAFGIRTAMGGRQARRLCPHAIVVPPRMSAYTEASRVLYAVFEDATPLVEGLSIDEAFLDVRGMERIAGSPVEIAARLKIDVRERVGIPVTVGVARTSSWPRSRARRKPDGLLVVPPNGEVEFLHPLPVEAIWGVGRTTGAKLRDRGIRTVADLARVPEPALEAMLGRAAGRQLHALANFRDPRPVSRRPRRRSIGSRTLAIGRTRRRRRPTPTSSRSSTGSCGVSGRPTASAGRSFSASASPTSRARRGHGHSSTRPRAPRSCSPVRASCSPMPNR